jgi:hypothetical protein
MPRLLIALCLLPLPAVAQSVCAFDAYTDFANPAPAIHAEPSAGSAQVGIAPHGSEAEDGFAFGAYVTVTEMQDGWAHVTNVVGWNDTTTAPDGWIDGENIMFTAQTDVMFAQPDPMSDVVWDVSEWPYIDALLDCDGAWAKIVFHDDDEVGHTGWVRGICATQETTCDGIFGDKAPSP